jgi:hypothetical protein
VSLILPERGILTHTWVIPRSAASHAPSSSASNHTSLPSTSSTAVHTGPQLPDLTHQYYRLLRDWDVRQPEQRFWNQDDWIAYEKTLSADKDLRGEQPKGSVRLKRNENVRMLYVCGPDGNAVDGRRAALIRDELKRAFQRLVACQLAPETWERSASDIAVAYVHVKIWELFPETGRCQRSWIINKICVEEYATFARRNGLRKIDKARAAGDDSESARASKRKKRSKKDKDGATSSARRHRQRSPGDIVSTYPRGIS